MELIEGLVHSFLSLMVIGGSIVLWMTITRKEKIIYYSGFLSLILLPTLLLVTLELPTLIQAMLGLVVLTTLMVNVAAFIAAFYRLAQLKKVRSHVDFINFHDGETEEGEATLKEIDQHIHLHTQPFNSSKDMTQRFFITNLFSAIIIVILLATYFSPNWDLVISNLFSFSPSILGVLMIIASAVIMFILFIHGLKQTIYSFGESILSYFILAFCFGLLVSLFFPFLYGNCYFNELSNFCVLPNTEGAQLIQRPLTFLRTFIVFFLPVLIGEFISAEKEKQLLRFEP